MAIERSLFLSRSWSIGRSNCRSEEKISNENGLRTAYWLEIMIIFLKLINDIISQFWRLLLSKYSRFKKNATVESSSKWIYIESKFSHSSHKFKSRPRVDVMTFWRTVLNAFSHFGLYDFVKIYVLNYYEYLVAY